MSTKDQIETFIQAVRRRLNRFRLADVALWSLAVASGLAVIIGLCYILAGYAVPGVWYGVLAGTAVLIGLVAYRMTRWSPDATAHYIDRFFGFKDAVTSQQHFRRQGKEGDFYDLQESATAEKVAQAGAETVRYRFPRRLAAVLGVLLGCAVLMSFKAPSAAVLKQIEEEKETVAKTEEINEYLEELIDELEKAATEEEEELVEADKLREWVDELKDTKDRKEALRQYAELERKLNEAANRLDQRKNEQLMAKAGEEVQKDQENHQLGKKLEDKKFEEAAQEIEDLKQEGEKKLSEQRKDLARTKAAAQRMAAAAKAANRKSDSSSASQTAANNKSSNSSGQGKSAQGSKGASGSGGGSGQGGSEMEGLLTELEKAAQNYEDALKNAELEERQTGECTSKTLGQCNAAKLALNQKLTDLSNSLCRMSSMKQSQSKLLSLCKGLGQCQGYLVDSQSQSLSAKTGGKKAGVGSVESRREGTEELVDNGQTSQLQGAKGQGPAMTSVEAADEGSGVSTRQATQKERNFQRQFESFVRREDVPDDVKEGVKEYFRSIHQAEQ